MVAVTIAPLVVFVVEIDMPPAPELPSWKSIGTWLLWVPTKIGRSRQATSGGDTQPALLAVPLNVIAPATPVIPLGVTKLRPPPIAPAKVIR